MWAIHGQSQNKYLEARRRLQAIHPNIEPQSYKSITKLKQYY